MGFGAGLRGGIESAQREFPLIMSCFDSADDRQPYG